MAIAPLVSHIQGGQGFHRLDESDTHRLTQEVFETYRCQPLGRCNGSRQIQFAFREVAQTRAEIKTE